MSEFYDVVFYGADSQADNLEVIKEKVAKLLKVNGAKLEALFEQESGTTLRKSVSLEVAQKYQKVLVDVGGSCDYKPSVKLELESLPENVSKEESKKEEGSNKFACPACGFTKKIREDVPIPVICPQCDIVPSVYEEEQEEKEERAKVIEQMRTKQKTERSDEDRREYKQKAEEEKLKQLEKTIKEKMAIPVYVSSRGRRMSSATLLLFVGMGLGVGSMLAYKQFFVPPPKVIKKTPLTAEAAINKLQKVGVASNPQATTMILKHMGVSSNVVNITAVMKRMGVLEKMSEISQSQQSLKAVATLSQQVIKGTVNVNDAAGSLVPSTVNDQILSHAEWDLTMISLMQQLIDIRKLSQAYQVSDYIHNPEWKFYWTGNIAATFTKQGNVDTSGMIRTKLRTETNKIAHIHERISKLSKLALLQSELDDLSAAQMLIQNAESLAKNIPELEIRALSLGYIASAQARIGLKAPSEANFKLANKLLTESGNVPAKLSAYVELAQAYAEAGEKGVALGILNEVLQASKKLTDTTQLGALSGRVAYVLSVAGDSQTAFEAITLIQPASLRDTNLYALMIEQVNANHLYQAMAILDRMETAEYLAKAHALLARMFLGTTLDGLVSDRFELAEQVTNHIIDVANKAKVASEVARYQFKIGKNEKSQEMFASAMTFAQQVENKVERERVFAHIVRNQALVGRIDQATQTASKIVDKVLQETVTQEIQALKKTHRILNSFEELL